MSSIKAVIKTKAYSTGEHPVFIYYNDKHLSFPQHKSIGITVPKEHFQKNKGSEYISKKIDSKSTPGLSTTYNNYINEILSKIKKADIDIRASNKYPELEDLFVFAGLIGNEEIKFFDFAQQHIDKKKVSTRNTYDQYLITIKAVLGENFLFRDFNEKTIHFLQKILGKDKSKEGYGLTNNSINMYVNLIRRICIDASKTPNPNNPKESIFDFKEHYFNNLKAKSESKGAITVQDIIKIINCELPPDKLHLEISRDVFIFQFFSQGNRISDVIRLLKEEVKGNKISITELKTSKDKNSPRLQAMNKIITKYWNSDSIYVFPILSIDKRLTVNNEELEKQLYKEQKNKISNINSNLKDIAKIAGVREDLSSHVARHTFASVADEKLRGDLKIIQAILNHSDRKTTENYIHDLRNNNYEEETRKVFEDFTFSEN